MLVHVDDGLVATNSLPLYHWILMEMNKQIEVVDQCVVSLYLGIQITHNCLSRKLWLSQRPFIVNLLTSHNLMNAHSSPIPLQHALHDLPLVSAGSLPDIPDNDVKVYFQRLIGSLLYLAICMRSNISYATMGLGRFNSNPTCSHLLAAKSVLRYLLGTMDFAPKYNFEQMPVGNPTSLFFLINCGFSDASDKSSCRSMSGFAFYLYGSLVSWSALSQYTVVLSSTEAEYICLRMALGFNFSSLSLASPIHLLFPSSVTTRALWISQILKPSTLIQSTSMSATISSKTSLPLVLSQRHGFLHSIWSWIISWSLYCQFTQEALYISQSCQFTLIFSFLFHTYIPSPYHFMCSITLMGMCWTIVLSCHHLHTYHVSIYFIWGFSTASIFSRFHYIWTLKMYIPIISDCPSYTHHTCRPVSCL